MIDDDQEVHDVALETLSREEYRYFCARLGEIQSQTVDQLNAAGAEARQADRMGYVRSCNDVAMEGDELMDELIELILKAYHRRVKIDMLGLDGLDGVM